MPRLHQPPRRVDARARARPGLSRTGKHGRSAVRRLHAVANRVHAARFVERLQRRGYNVAFAASAAPGLPFARWRLDDEAIAYPTYAVIADNKDQLKEHPGFFNICIHKGLSANGTQPGGANNLPNFGNPDDMVKVATDWPQFNWVIYHACIRPGFWALQALQDIENLSGAMTPTTLTDSDGHTVPNIRWSTQLAQIAAGKYVAGAEPFSTSPSSTRRLRNIYAELGTTMASLIVTFPTVWAHLIGQLLYYMGENNIVFGSNSLWYGPAMADRGAVALADPRRYRQSMGISATERRGKAQNPRAQFRTALRSRASGAAVSNRQSGELSDDPGASVRRTPRHSASRARLSGARDAGRPWSQRRPIRKVEAMARGPEARSQQRAPRLDADRRVRV